MEQFPSFTKKESSKSPLEIANSQGQELDALMAKRGSRFGQFFQQMRLAILIGSLSVVAVGCGSKKSEQAEVASRFPQAAEVEKTGVGIKNERRTIDNKRYGEINKKEEIAQKRALEIAERHGIDMQAMQAGNFTLETRNVGEVPISIKINGKNIEVSRQDLTEKELATLKMIAPTFSDPVYTDDSREMKAQKEEITRNNRQTRAILERLGVTGDAPTSLENAEKGNTPGSKIRTSPDFDSKPGVRGSKPISLDNF